MNAKEFWQKALSEADGVPSFSRVTTGVLVICAAGWVTHLVLHNHALPDFGGLSLFLGTLYGLNKVATAMDSLNGPRKP